MNKKITHIRKNIDQLDELIMQALELRFTCVRELAPLKGKKLLNKTREQEILRKCSSDEIRQVYQKIFSVGVKKMRAARRRTSKLK